MILVPTEWSWQADAAQWMERHYVTLAVCAALYYPVIFGIREVMKNREPFDLGGEKTKCMVNYIFWWEIGLAVFSLVGALNVVPMIASDGFGPSAICSTGQHDDKRSFWVFLFALSKVIEFGDTLFIVLRKKPLVLLQHYHHLATMLYCWYAGRYVWQYNNTNAYFAGMNLCVHTVMYSWYAATRKGWRSPKILMMMVTLIQSVQMIFGLAIVAISVSSLPGCGTWMHEQPRGAIACLIMYASYFVLFGQLFYDNYLAKKAKHSKAKNGASGQKEIAPADVKKRN